jgi:hypothetical protein
MNATSHLFKIIILTMVIIFSLCWPLTFLHHLQNGSFSIPSHVFPISAGFQPTLFSRVGRAGPLPLSADWFQEALIQQLPIFSIGHSSIVPCSPYTKLLVYIVPCLVSSIPLVSIFYPLYFCIVCGPYCCLSSSLPVLGLHCSPSSLLLVPGSIVPCSPYSQLLVYCTLCSVLLSPNPWALFYLVLFISELSRIPHVVYFYLKEFYFILHICITFSA